MVGGGFKMSRSELNLSVSGWEKAGNEQECIINNQKWVGVDGNEWKWVGMHESGWEHGLV